MHAQTKFSRRCEYFGGIGSSHFLGDLGGANNLGTSLLNDLNPSTTGVAFTSGIRYKRYPELAFKSLLTLAWVSGNDNRTEEPFRKNRNLSFSSPIIELSVNAELYLNKEKRGTIYKASKITGKKVRNVLIYIFAGIGGFWYRPMARYQNEWYDLKKIGTEGQNLANGPKKYSGFSISLPHGIGIKVPMSKTWTIGLEFGPRYTFTDYIDDVSGVYANNDEIKAKSGDLAAYLADPNLGAIRQQWDSSLSKSGRTLAGTQRGDRKDKDTFAFFLFSFTFKPKQFMF